MVSFTCCSFYWRWRNLTTICFSSLIILIRLHGESVEWNGKSIFSISFILVFVDEVHDFSQLSRMFFLSEPVAFRRVYGLESYSRTSGESNHHRQSVSDTRVPRYQLHHEDDSQLSRMLKSSVPWGWHGKLLTANSIMEKQKALKKSSDRRYVQWIRLHILSKHQLATDWWMEPWPPARYDICWFYPAWKLAGVPRTHPKWNDGMRTGEVVYLGGHLQQGTDYCIARPCQSPRVLGQDQIRLHFSAFGKGKVTFISAGKDP